MPCKLRRVLLNVEVKMKWCNTYNLHSFIMRGLPAVTSVGFNSANSTIIASIDFRIVSLLLPKFFRHSLYSRSFSSVLTSFVWAPLFWGSKLVRNCHGDVFVGMGAENDDTPGIRTVRRMVMRIFVACLWFIIIFYFMVCSFQVFSGGRW
jgi:hypothetical protein